MTIAVGRAPSSRGWFDVGRRLAKAWDRFRDGRGILLFPAPTMLGGWLTGTTFVNIVVHTGLHLPT